MDTTPVGLFATKARASNRLLYGDLRRLQRDVLPTGARTREEVEALLTLDSSERVDRDWPGYLARVVTEYVLSISEPRGVVDAETAAWLGTALADARPRSAAAFVRALLREAQHVDEALVAFGRRGAARTAVPEIRRAVQSIVEECTLIAAIRLEP
jgi:hypothetical protein